MCMFGRIGIHTEYDYISTHNAIFLEVLEFCTASVHSRIHEKSVPNIPSTVLTTDLGSSTEHNRLILILQARKSRQIPVRN